MEINLNDVIVEQLSQSAQNSVWVPAEYSMNEIVYDCCQFLEGPRNMKSIDDVVAERNRQVSKEGFDSGHDDKYKHNELALAAVVYALPTDLRREYFADLWPWDTKWYKSTNRRRNLVKAAALIIAEIDRIDRNA